jgi:putative DNA primase/helicase
MLSNLQIAFVLGGKVHGNGVIAPGPDRGPDDMSLSIVRNAAGDDFIVTSQRGDDPVKCRIYVDESLERARERAAENKRGNDQIKRQNDGHFAREAANLGMPALAQPDWTGRELIETSDIIIIEPALTDSSDAKTDVPVISDIVTIGAQPPVVKKVVELAIDLAHRGWYVFPCSPRDKSPLVAKWKEAASNYEPAVRKMFGRFPTAMIGVAAGEKSGVWCLDPDAPTDKNPIDGREQWNTLQAEHGAAPATHTHITPGGGNHLIFKWRADRSPVTNREGALKGRHINVRGEGGYFIAADSVNSDGVEYRMAEPLDCFNFAPAPDWLHDLIDGKPDNADLPIVQSDAAVSAPAAVGPVEVSDQRSISERALDSMADGTYQHPNPGSAGTSKGYAAAALASETAKLATTKIDRNITLNNSALSLGRFVKSGELTEADVINALVEASETNGYDKEHGRSKTLATIASGMSAAVARAIPLNAKLDPDRQPQAVATGAEGGGSEIGEPEAPLFSEIDLANKFVTLHEENLRFVAKWGSWMIWDRVRWQFDETMRAFDLARAICRQASKKANKPSEQKALASAKTVAAVEKLSRAYRTLAAITSQWDAVPRKFNTTTTTIDLNTGTGLAPDRMDFITQNAGCEAAPIGTKHPIWTAFLARITNNDAELATFLQRYVGYCLTGDITEHVFVFAYGTGANGKGVFLNTIAKIFGEYATVADMATFIDSKSDRHPTELAKLRGARLVVAQETQQGRAWDEAKIKAITGGDKQTARFMRQDFFDFYPTFKLFIAGNHKPTLKNVDEAMRRRLLLVPFTVQIPLAERDIHLTEKLEAEWPAILRWAIDGCLEWQRIGLSPPKVVTDATNEYFAAEDGFGQWLEDECEIDIGNSFKWEAVGALFESWTAYSTTAGNIPGTAKNFAEMLANRGATFVRKGKDRTRSYEGIRLKPKPASWNDQ